MFAFDEERLTSRTTGKKAAGEGASQNISKPHTGFLGAAHTGRPPTRAVSRAPAAAKMPASDEELREIEELKAMIHGTPSRGSTVPLGAVTRFMVGEENRKKADDARKEKEERDALKAEVDAMRKANADRVRAKRQEIIDNERKVRENERQRKQAEGQRLREREASWKAKAAAKSRRTGRLRRSACRRRTSSSSAWRQ